MKKFFIIFLFVLIISVFAIAGKDEESWGTDNVDPNPVCCECTEYTECDKCSENQDL